MKKIVVIVILIIIAIIGISVISLPKGSNQQQDNSSDIVLTAEEVAKHNTGSDCWLIIDGKVYSVADYIPVHSAGPEKIIASCGNDATEGFKTKGVNPPQDHQQTSYDLLGSYYIGDLGGSMKK